MLTSTPITTTTLYPGEPLKNKLAIFADHIYSLVRHGEFPADYFFCGLDRKNTPGVESVFSTRKQMSLIRKQVTRSGGTDVETLLKDKLLFGLVADASRVSTPRNIGLFELDTVECLSPRRTLTYEAFITKHEGLCGFCKPIVGGGGRGAFAVDIRHGRMTFNHSFMRSNSVRSHIQKTMLLQERIVQHPSMAELYPLSVNTIRLITQLRDRQVAPLVAALRIGAHGSVVDNLQAGGMVVGIDLDSGQLRGKGLFKKRMSGEPGRVSCHPDTATVLEGHQLPMFQEAVDLACRFHRSLGRLPTIGWDLALTSTSPCIIEGNTYWNASMFIALYPGFKQKCLDAIHVTEDTADAVKK